jgi:hypothetical protein
MGRGVQTLDEQLEDLQRRYQLLEGEKKSLIDTSHQSIKQNREIIEQLKNENKNCRLVLSQNKDINSNKISNNEISELNQTKNKYNNLINENNKKELLLNDLNNKLIELQNKSKSLIPLKNGDASNPLTRQIRVLENRIDKSMIKYNEAQSIKRTYEQILKQLKEERIGFDQKISQYEEELKLKKKDYEELLLLSHDAMHAKEMAQAELHRFEQGVMEERNQRDREVQEKKILVQQRIEMNNKLEQKEKFIKQSQTQISPLSPQSDPSSAPSAQHHHHHHNTEKEIAKLAEYEEAFRKVKEITGVSDVNEIIQKFLTQQKTKENLTVVTNEQNKKIENLNLELIKIKNLNNEIKFSGNSGIAGRRQAIEELEKHLIESENKYSKNTVKFEKLTKILISLNSGISHLYLKLNEIKIDGTENITEEVNEDTMEEILTQIELKINKLLTLTSNHDSEDDEDEISTERVQPVDIRIKLPNHEIQMKGVDEDDDINELKLNERKLMKQQSEQLIEKYLKKMKKKKN